MRVAPAIAAIRRALDRRVFLAFNETSIEAQVAAALAEDEPAAFIERQHRSAAGRYDIFATLYLSTVVLELKLHAPVAAVERQAQRYALMPDVDAVGVVTTSRRLAAGLMGPSGESMLGGKPLFVIALRTT
jgi:hypothetical protein